MTGALLAIAGWLGFNGAVFVWRWWTTRNDPVTIDWREALGR